jgi:AhpD family alkylhydroperoxidase
VIHYITPVKDSEAQGLVGAVYRQMKHDFGMLAEPYILHSPEPELLAGAWALGRESAMPGAVPQHVKEAVAAAVSRTNTCPYCVEAHELLFVASGTQEVPDLDHPDTISDPRTRAIVEWALATRTPSSPILLDPPFSAGEAPELLARVVVFEYFNRMVKVLLDRSLLADAPLVRLPWIRRLMRPVVLALLSRAVKRNTAAGASLEFLSNDADLPHELRWAKSHPVLGRAMSAFHHTTAELGEHVLPEDARSLVRGRVSVWQGEDMGLSRRWAQDAVADLDPSTRPAARLALLTALASHQVDESVVDAFRQRAPEDRQLLALLSWASWLAAVRVGSWLWPASAESVPPVGADVHQSTP